MSAQTFKQLQDDVLFNTFDEKKYRDRAGRALNDGARRMASRVLWGWSRTTLDVTDGMAQIPLPGLTAIQAVSVIDATGGRGNQLVSSRDPDDVVSGCYFTTLGDAGTLDLYVDPAIARVGVDGYRLPATMVNPDDPCELGPDASEGLVSFARAQLYKREDDPDMYAQYMADFDREVKAFSQRTWPLADGLTVTPGMWAGSVGGG